MGTLSSPTRYRSPPVWSSWPWVSKMASTRSFCSISQVNSGRIRSTPYMSGSGNMSPTSMTSRRPLTSTAQQLRPISPSPPRKVTRTAASAMEAREPRSDLGGPRVERLVGGAEREPALADGQSDRAQHRLGRQRVRPAVRALECERFEQSRVLGDGSVEVALHEQLDRTGELRATPMRRDRDEPDRADRQEGEDEPVVPAVDVEAPRRGLDEPGGAHQVGGGVLHAHDVGVVGGH